MCGLCYNLVQGVIHLKKYLKLLILFSLALFIILPLNIQGNGSDVTILFTHDFHDNHETYNTEIDGSIVERGGIARLSTAIKNEQKNSDPLIVDGGDYSQGTLFQSIFTTHAPTLHLFDKLGYDATTFGNHEFDFRPQGLADSLNAAAASNLSLQIISSNTNYDVDNKSAELSALEQAVNNYGVKDYTIVEKNGVRIGLMGLMGVEADSNAPMAEVIFDNYITGAKRVSASLKAEGVDMIVALSHSGTSSNAKQSEDEILAKEVGDIDLIVSAHSHSRLDEPIIVNNTAVVSAGRYGENLGKIVLQPNGDRWTISTYDLIPIDNTLAEDPEILEMIEDYKVNVNEQYLSKYGLSFNDVLAQSPFGFTPASQLAKTNTEEPLAHFIGDAYIDAVKQIEKENYVPVDIAVVPSGVLRDSITQGDVLVKDAFKILPLGVGKDGISGYPLLSVYLTGKEIKLAAEIDASISPILSFAKLYITGMSYELNPNRIILNKVTESHLFDGVNKSDINDDQLYRVVADLYSAQMLGVVNDMSYGLLSLAPKDANGELITNYEDHIIYDGNKQELKMWVALTDYLKASPKNSDGVPEIDMKYSAPQGYKIINNESAFFSRFTNMNMFAWLIIGVILFALLLLASIVYFVVRIIKKRRNKKQSL